MKLDYFALPQDVAVLLYSSFDCIVRVCVILHLFVARAFFAATVRYYHVPGILECCHRPAGICGAWKKKKKQ